MSSSRSELISDFFLSEQHLSFLQLELSMYTSMLSYCMMTTCSLNSLKLFLLESVRCLSFTGTSYLAMMLTLLISDFGCASVFSYLLAYILHFDFKDFSLPLKQAKLQGERLNLISCCNFLGIRSSSIFSAVKPDPFFIILLLTPSNFCALGRSHIFIFYLIIYLASYT